MLPIPPSSSPESSPPVSSSPASSTSNRVSTELEIRRILCPIDFSEASLKTMERAAELALRFQAELRILHVVPFPPPLPPEVGFAASEIICLEREQLVRLERQVEEAATRLGPQVNARAQVLQGNEAHQIVHTAEEGADLIVLSTHGRSGWKRLCYGSVTEKVLHHAPCPVLVFRHLDDPAQVEDNETRATSGATEVAPPRAHKATLLPLKTILCPIDYSEASQMALGVAAQWAEQFKARLDVLHVVPTISQEVAPGEYAAPEYNRIWLDADREKLCEFVNHTAAQTVDAQPLVRLGDAAAGIERTAQEERADLIALSTHGYGGWKHLVFGSVAEKVLRSTMVPMLIVRTPAP